MICLREVFVLLARSGGAEAREGDLTVTDRSGIPQLPLGHAIVNRILVVS